MTNRKSNVPDQKGKNKHTASPAGHDASDSRKEVKPKNLAMIFVLYLLGLFMGNLDTGIVAPARGVIQNQLGVNETIGIWMITIYTLAYATSIPISGKLADRYGRKTMYLISIFLFGLGSLLCSFSDSTGGFAMLLIGRVVQAIGGGGIMPIVTAEIGTTFPPEKRGMALGLVGGIYGIANILGSSAGSAILGIAGNTGWHWLFLINVPISLFILVGAFFALENHRNAGPVKKMDIMGSVILSGMILSLMYGLTNVKFFDFAHSVSSLKVYPFLLLFVLLIPVFIFVERHAADPVIALKYFTDRNMVITFITSVLVGVALMGMIFVPQFAENALKMKTGSGGYFVTVLGLFAGIGAPLSGKLIDRFGAKIVLIGGFSFTLTSGLFLAFVATKSPTISAVLFSLFLMGLGMGFTMGTPLNYMILSMVPKRESNSALATLSLIRSIGTVLSPALMVGFLANAGTGLQTTLMEALPAPPARLEIRQVEELKPLLARIQENPDLAANLPAEMLDVDKMMSGNASSIDMQSGRETLPEELLNSLQSADVTNIVDRMKVLADYMIKTNVTTEVIQAAADGVQKGIDGLNTGLSEMDKAAVELQTGLTDAKTKQDELKKSITEMDAGKKGIQGGMDGLTQAIAGLDAGLAKPNPVLQAQRDNAALQKAELEKQLADLEAAQSGMRNVVAGLDEAIAGMAEGLTEMAASRELLQETAAKMTEIRDAIPAAFEASRVGYLNTLEGMRAELEGIFQKGLNGGFHDMYVMVAILSGLAIVVLLFYTYRKREEEEIMDSKPLGLGRK